MRFRWPGKLEAGGTNDGMMHIVDLYSALITIGKGHRQKRVVDSIDMTDTIFANISSSRRSYTRFPGASLPAIVGDYKLIGKVTMSS